MKDLRERAEALKEKLNHWRSCVQGGYPVPTDMTSIIESFAREIIAPYEKTLRLAREGADFHKDCDVCQELLGEIDSTLALAVAVPEEK